MVNDSSFKIKASLILCFIFATTIPIHQKQKPQRIEPCLITRAAAIGITAVMLYYLLSEELAKHSNRQL